MNPITDSLDRDDTKLLQQFCVTTVIGVLSITNSLEQERASLFLLRFLENPSQNQADPLNSPRLRAISKLEFLSYVFTRKLFEVN